MKEATTMIGTNRCDKYSKEDLKGALCITKKIEPETDRGFYKIWLRDILKVLDSCGNGRMKVLGFLLKEMRTSDNSVSATQKYIAEHAGVSKMTVSSSLKAFIKANILKKTIGTTYQFNPDVIAKANSKRRRLLVIEYSRGE